MFTETFTHGAATEQMVVPWFTVTWVKVTLAYGPGVPASPEFGMLIETGPTESAFANDEKQRQTTATNAILVTTLRFIIEDISSSFCSMTRVLASSGHLIVSGLVRGATAVKLLKPLQLSSEKLWAIKQCGRTTEQSL